MTLPRWTAFICLLLFASIFAACTGTPTPEATPEPFALVTGAAQIRTSESFRLTVDQTGPDYEMITDYGTVFFRRATAQYVAPDTMQAQVRVRAIGLSIDVDVFSRGEDQWYRAIWTGNQWINAPFAPGFNPATLIGEDTGFQAALNAVTTLAYVGTTTLEDGTAVHHVSGTADGALMNALLVGLIEMQGTVQVDLYVDQTTGQFTRFVVNEPVYATVVVETTDQVGEAGLLGVPTTLPDIQPPSQEIIGTRVWTIDISDVNVPAQLDDPEAAGGTRLGAEATEGA